MTLKIFSCPAKLIIGRTLEIWQLDVLVMQMIYIISTFDHYFKITLPLYCQQKVRSHAKAKGIDNPLFSQKKQWNWLKILIHMIKEVLNVPKIF